MTEVYGLGYINTWLSYRDVAKLGVMIQSCRLYKPLGHVVLRPLNNY